MSQRSALIVRPTYPKKSILEAFSQVAYPFIYKNLGLKCCISATRLTIEVMRQFEIHVRPQAVTLTVGLPHLSRAIYIGFPPEELATVRTRPPKPEDEIGWLGHVVGMVDYLDGRTYLLDPSFGQAVSQLWDSGHRFEWQERVILIQLPNVSALRPVFEVSGSTSCGQPILLRYAEVNDKTFQKESSWKLLPIQELVQEIVTHMHTALSRSRANR